MSNHENLSTKYIVFTVDNEAVLRFMIISDETGSNFERTEAILASNPVIRFVDDVNLGDVWNGTEYTTPA
jgi:hypothetical protein